MFGPRKQRTNVPTSVNNSFSFGKHEILVLRRFNLTSLFIPTRNNDTHVPHVSNIPAAIMRSVVFTDMALVTGTFLVVFFPTGIFP